MVSGQSYSCNITLTNTGGLPWSTMNGTRLYLRGDNPAFGVPDYINLPAGNWSTGSSFTFNFTMKAPNVVSMTNYTNAWYAMYMDYSYGPYGTGWFGTGYPIYTFPKITVLPVPRASTIFGDWYNYKLLSPSNATLIGSTAADTDYASPNWASTIKVIPSSYVPTINSNGAGLTNTSYATPGVYTLQISNSYVYETTPEVAYRVWIWDNMKMGQRADQDAMAKLAAKKFIDPASTPRNIYQDDRVGMVTFGTDATMDLPLKFMRGANISNPGTGLKEAISAINSYGDTNTADALMLAVDEFRNNPNPNGKASKNIILLTDGYSTSSPSQNAAQVQRIIDNNIKVYTIGIADDSEQGRRGLPAGPGK